MMLKHSIVVLTIAVLMFVVGCVTQPTVTEGNQTIQPKNETTSPPSILTPAQTANETAIVSNRNESQPTTSDETLTQQNDSQQSTQVILQNLSLVDLQNFSRLEKNCFGFLAGSSEELEMVESVGAGWARPHPGPFAWGFIEEKEGVFDFNQTDEYVKTAQESNVLILATIWPFADWDQQSDANCRVSEQDIFYPRPMMEKDWKDGYFVQVEKNGFSGIPAFRCKPKNMEKYKEFLKKLVERYDGDGVEDMQGLKLPVRYYEVSNEPEMQSETLTFFKGSEADYVEVLKASSEAVKEACGECVVVQGGAASAEEWSLSFWGNVFALGGGNYFDVANIHFVKFWDAQTLNVQAFKQLLDKHGIRKPIWITEVEYDYGSSDVVVENSVQGAFEAGASKMFFTSFNVGGHDPPRAGEYAQVYKKIAEKGCG